MNLHVSAIILILGTAMVSADPIDELVVRLGNNAAWKDPRGGAKIALPPTSKLQDVVSRHFRTSETIYGMVRRFEIAKSRKVKIPASGISDLTAVWCATDKGGRILLIWFESTKKHWRIHSFKGPDPPRRTIEPNKPRIPMPDSRQRSSRGPSLFRTCRAAMASL